MAAAAGLVLRGAATARAEEVPGIPAAPAPTRSPQPPVDVLTLAGAPRERGRIHAEALRSRILDFVPIRKANLGRPESLSPDDYVERFLSETDFESAIRRSTPDVLEEIRGIAAGSGVPYRTVLAMRLVDGVCDPVTSS